jgi:hypothetical protein
MGEYRWLYLPSFAGGGGGGDRVKGVGKGMHPCPQQAGPKIPSPLNAREKGRISCLHVLSGLWSIHLQ